MMIVGVFVVLPQGGIDLLAIMSMMTSVAEREREGGSAELRRG